MSNKLTGNSTALREYKQTITLSQIQMEILVGTLLGDACISLDNCVQFEQCIARENYIWHLYEIFRDFVGTPPRVKKIRGGGAGDRQSLRFRTYRHPDFEFYYNLFYPAHPGCRRKKRVAESISELLTARALAYWFMDDGSALSRKARRYYVFNTHSFPLEDQGAKGVVDALRDNFDIDATIKKPPLAPYYVLYIRSKSTERFIDLIHPSRKRALF
uniref:Putative LAGLIDADG DNA endonuclease n=1 Tax=Ostreobium quekettii TaxID=121088 RepID=A0A650BXX3_9CHLO|nr:putative LAGLIDADG DNA endonuclease [Ostreobium quekettii]QGQ61983.1 putative LAGLIDADG DNA endonuclease [Ostreobium quekettii]